MFVSLQCQTLLADKDCAGRRHFRDKPRHFGDESLLAIHSIQRNILGSPVAGYAVCLGSEASPRVKLMP